MWLVLSHQEPQTQYKSEIKEKTLSRQESLDGLRISQKSAKTPLFTEFSDGLGGVFHAVCEHQQRNQNSWRESRQLHVDRC